MPHSNALKAFWLRFYEALSQGDQLFIERHFSQSEGVLVTGANANGSWTRHATTSKMLKTELARMVGLQIVPGDLQACCEGAVGCVTDRPKLRRPDGVEIPMRVTAVICREEDDWKIVLWHASFGVPYEEAFGKTLSV